VAWAGTAVVLGGGINLLQHGLGAVHLRAGVLALITALIIVLTTLVSVLQERRTRRDAFQELEESLDGMLACWPPRSAARITPYDVGVHPDLADVGDSPPYVERDRDAELDSALRETGIAVVFGPPGAGKSRSAFEAVRRVAPDAAMIIPTSAEGLGNVMQQARALPLLEQPTVLWLDGLERFSETLDVDPIDALVHPEPRRGSMRRLLRKPVESPRTTVVATIRSDDLERLLAGDGDESHEMRRFLAHARGIPLDDKLSGDERRQFEETYGHEPAGPTLAEAFPRRWSDGWQKAAPRQPARDKGGIGVPVWPAVLAAALAGLVVWLVSDVNDGGWTEPPPLKTQISQLADAVRKCQHLSAYPKDGKGLGDRGVLVAIVDGRECPMSDEVRFYRQKSKRLEQISALVPDAQGPTHTFSCIGESKIDPCHVRLAGRLSVIVGAFRDTDKFQELPLVVSFGGDKGLQLSPLAPPARPPPGLPPLPDRNMTVRLGVGNTAPVAAACQQSHGCLRGRPAAATAVLAPTDTHPAILLAGYVARGTAEAPVALAVRAWRITVPPDGVPKAQRRRDCVVLIDGTPASLRPGITSPAAARGALLTSAKPKGSQLMC
jgi:hypothetical protein